MRLILASNSPRRKELLAHTGLQFVVIPSTYHENDRASTPEATVQLLATKKGEEVFAMLSDDVMVISSDTIVVHNGEIFNKPDNREHARQMLSQLSGSTHEVMTSVAFFYRYGGTIGTEHLTIKTKVTFKPISNSLMELYLATGEGDDKAGSYGIQAKGLLFVDKIEGSYSNVVGFPLSDIVTVLNEIAKKHKFNNFAELFS